MYDTIIEALRAYFLTCPLIGSSGINVDFLPETATGYSIDPVETMDGIIRRYANGDTKKQYLFAFRSVNEYGSDAAQNLLNSGFYEQLSAWLDDRTNAGVLPELPPGMDPELVEAMSTGHFISAGTDVGNYQIQCRLVYLQKG